MPGRVVTVGPVPVFRGPADNLAVTSLAIDPPGSLLEGTSVQLTADVQTERAGVRPSLLWATADPTVASVTTDGFLVALTPGDVRVSVVAGSHDDEIVVTVVPRATGLGFVQQPGDTDLGRPLAPAPSVQIVDARGDRVESASTPVSLELEQVSGTGTPFESGLGGSTTVVSQQGLATFPDLSVDGVGVFRLLASAAGLTPSASTEFLVQLFEADLEVLKEADRAVAAEGEPVSFQVLVTNKGPHIARGVVITDRAPSGLGLVEFEVSQGDYQAIDGRWHVGSLGVGESASLRMETVVEAGTEGRTLINTARADVLVFQADEPTNNEASVSVEIGSRDADIEVFKRVDRSSAKTGDVVEYVITVLNHGPDEAIGIVVDENLPDGLVIDEAQLELGGFDQERRVWRIPSLAAGEQAGLRVRTRVSLDVAPGTVLSNTARARELAGQRDDPSNNEATATVHVIMPYVDLEIVKGANRTTAYEGESVTYMIKVTNHGPAVSTGAEVFETLPLGLHVPEESFSVSQGTLSEGEGGGWAIGRLEPGASATLTLAATIEAGAAGTDIVNSVSVVPGADEPDPDMSNNVGEATLHVPALPPSYPSAATTLTPTPRPR